MNSLHERMLPTSAGDMQCKFSTSVMQKVKLLILTLDKLHFVHKKMLWVIEVI